MLDNNQVVLEQEVLCSMFRNNKLIIKAKDSIKPEMFLYDKHMKIYLGILDMVNNKMEVDLVTFLQYHSTEIKNMDGASYISDIYTCNGSDSGFNTKLELLIKNYKKHLYVEMMNKLNGDMALEDIEGELENVKVKVHKCEIKKELDIVSQFDDYINWLYNSDRNNGIKSDFIHLDKYLGNFQKGRLITVFARSGVGKTTFSLQLAANMIENKAKVFYGSAEMTRNQVFNRMAASHLSISSKSIDDDSINNQDKDNITKYMAKLLNSSFYESTETDFNKFINEVKVYKLQNSLDVVFVDYINKYIDFGDKDIMTNKLGKISGMLKTLAMEEDICIVLMAQANRVVDKKGGDMAIEKIDSSDIQDSARIEQDSDQVIALYRNIKLDDKMYRETLFKKGKLKYSSKNADENPECINAILIKNRHGDRGTCALRWNGRYSRVTNF